MAEEGFLSPDDARILALESAVVTGHTLKLMILEPGEPLDLEDIRRRVESQLHEHPRARERVETEGGRPRWVAAENFDVSRHVRRYPERVASSEDLRRAVGTLMAEHLDHRHPLWTVDVIGPLDDGRQALAARLHHAMVDGIAGTRLLQDLVADPREDPTSTVGVRPHTRRPRRSLWHRLPAAIGRELGHPGSRSPFDRPLTARRELAFATVSLSGLKAIGASRPAYATVNDALMAVVAGGLRSWLGETAAHLDLRAQIPVSLHHQDDGPGVGNRDSFMNVTLALGASDPLTRLDRISAQTRAAKQADDAELMYDLLHAVGQLHAIAGLPSASTLLDRVESSPREFSVAISNVPGPRGETTVSGRRVAELFSSSEPGAHHTLRIAAISHADAVGIGFCTDPTAVPDVAGLAAAVEGAYGELQRAAL
ncbi:wax ester/triacylglycerol synthase family O-acyltransferase [Microbacterium sp. SSW1-59]|uniref:wax ester/triacylglycerol synthase domain-containing protein n=1 Tax=Microbacterium xanthum TaxID=3079794 RepID=UPI002AD57A3D|nr:wax ester/triacylglycerol synthase domain-containing protein [Microbacterium sp. SSW1-59]MDZ8202683.1 wax ester/triacylglycerol synthase family O-acyltransferase [Microbacterium sp. SSW1-59]